MPPGTHVRIQLLGPFAVILPDGRRAGPWGRPPARRLVQLLALQPDARLTREAVAAALFPNLVPGRAANAVAKAASLARGALRGDADAEVPLLVGDRTTLWLDRSLFELDLADHRDELARALAMYPSLARDRALGEALADASPLLPDEPYADWATLARDSLQALRHEARLALARDRTAGFGRTELDAVIEAWTSVASGQSTSEEAAVGLINAYRASGQRDRAIRAYLRVSAALREEIGVEPGPDLEEAYRTLAPVQRTVAARAGRSTELLQGRPLYGRAAIRRQLRRRLGNAPNGLGPALMLTGPAGIGKSLLLATLAAEVERAGWLVLHGVATHEDREAPFAALRAAIAAVADQGDLADLPLLARMLAASELPAAPDNRDPGGAARARMTVELGWFLDRIASASPVLLVLDDLQWADPAMQTVLHRLALRPGPRRWAMLAAARDDEPAAPPPTFAQPGDVIRVPPLRSGATQSAVRATLRADGVRVTRKAIIDAAERSLGNPFFAVELARSTAGASDDGPRDQPGPSTGSVPEAIVSLLRRRFDHLSETARTFLSLAALAGMETSYELLLLTAEHLGGGLEGRGVQALDELIEAHLVVEIGDRLAMAHPLLRDAAISTTNAIRRSAVHAAIADALDEMEDRLPAASGEQSARHRLAAFGAARLPSMAPAAAAAGFREGQRAHGLYAEGAAHALLRGALDAYETLDPGARAAMNREAAAAWLTIGHIHLDRDDATQAQAAYEAALATATVEADVARAWSALAGVPYRFGRLREALATYRRGLRALVGADPMARARLESDAAWSLIRLGRPEAALRILERVAPVLEDAPETHVRCRLRDRMGMALVNVGRRDEALASFGAGIAEARARDDERELMVISMHRAPLLASTGRLDEAMEDARLAADIAERSQDRYSRAVAHWITAEVFEHRGDLEAALAERDAEISILVRIDNPRNLAIAQAHRAKLNRLLGRSHAAAAAATAARSAMRRVDDVRLTADLEAELAGPAGPRRRSKRGKSSGTVLL